MPDPKILLLAALLALTAAFVLFWIAQERARPQPGPLLSGLHTLIGFLTNFFDTLGIGSFATTTTVYRLWRLVPVQQVPGTLNVGDALPTVAQALIYITIVAVGFETLAVLILSAVGGSWIGASIVAGMRCTSSMKSTSRACRLVRMPARSPGRSSTGPDVDFTGTPSSFAMTYASVVLPRPGGPNSST